MFPDRTVFQPELKKTHTIDSYKSSIATHKNNNSRPSKDIRLINECLKIYPEIVMQGQHRFNLTEEIKNNPEQTGKEQPTENLIKIYEKYFGETKAYTEN